MRYSIADRSIRERKDFDFISSEKEFFVIWQYFNGPKITLPTPFWGLHPDCAIRYANIFPVLGLRGSGEPADKPGDHGDETDEAYHRGSEGQRSYGASVRMRT